MTDLLPGFDTRTVPVGPDHLLVRTAGAGAPLLLLHGFPETHLMWHRLAPVLAAEFRVVLVDLPGYGASAAPPEGPARYSKRRMAADVAAVMATLGHPRFTVVGHDRGARVAYRLALDAPERVAALAVLDIVPTGAVWGAFSVARALSYYHWLFLAQPAPLPETLIGHDSAFYLRHTMASWTKAGTLQAFHPAALEAYAAAFADPARTRAACDDYRAGATLDWDHDRADHEAGRRIAQPLLALWGAHFAAGDGRSPLDTWREWATDADGAPIDSGHFLPEEAPNETLARLLPFLRARAA